MANGSTDYVVRARLLSSALRQVRHRADISATGATIHHLRSSIASAHTALQMVEERLPDGDTATLDLLLGFVQDAIESAQLIIAQTRGLERTV